MRYILPIVGAAISLLGAFWLLQGLGLITVEPLLCVTNCEAVVGPDLSWTAAGLFAVGLGLLAIRVGTQWH